jgi:hypothetical protein
MFTFTITLAVLVRVADSVPKLTTYLAAYSSLASLGVFLYLIDHVGKSLRPSGALRNGSSPNRRIEPWPRLATSRELAARPDRAKRGGRSNWMHPAPKPAGTARHRDRKRYTGRT